MMVQLTAVEKAALDEYHTRLVPQFPKQVLRLVLFGSKARGDAKSDSDIDVLVIVRGDGGDAQHEQA